jgi:hypothetical protein
MAPSAHRNAFAPNQKPAHHPVYPKLRRQVRAAHVVAAMVNTVPVRAAALFVIPTVEGSLILGSESRQPTARTQSTKRPRTSGRCSPAWPHQAESTVRYLAPYALNQNAALLCCINNGTIDKTG